MAVYTMYLMLIYVSVCIYPSAIKKKKKNSNVYYVN